MPVSPAPGWSPRDCRSLSLSTSWMRRPLSTQALQLGVSGGALTASHLLLPCVCRIISPAQGLSFRLDPTEAALGVRAGFQPGNPQELRYLTLEGRLHLQAAALLALVLRPVFFGFGSLGPPDCPKQNDFVTLIFPKSRG